MVSNKFAGQWQGTSELGIHYVANLDKRDGHYTGRLSSIGSLEIDGQNMFFWSWSTIEAQIQDDVLKGKASAPTIHKRDGEIFNEKEWALLKEKVPDFYVPIHSEFEARPRVDGGLIATWVSFIQDEEDIRGEVKLDKRTTAYSSLIAEEMTWNEFKTYALKQGDGVVFRGQAKHSRLQTSFHRTGRADLIDYIDTEVRELERYMNIYTDHLYDADDDRSLGALLNLAQHHGYPTPLLDWTRSPFVAAFFAFENKYSIAEDGRVTIFVFKEKEWSKRAGKYAPIRTPSMIVRALDLQGYGNSRVIPQQALTMYSNVDDIEALIAINETTPGYFLKAISIPGNSRNDVMRELSLMGITWASMFPGLDGVCKQLSRSHFE